MKKILLAINSEDDLLLDMEGLVCFYLLDMFLMIKMNITLKYF